MACVVVLLVCVAAIGVSCTACVVSHPGQAVGHTLVSIPVGTAPPAVAWDLVFLLALASFLIVRPRFLSLRRASPAQLQRFLF